MEKPQPKIHIIIKDRTPEEILAGLSLDSTQIKRATFAIYQAIEKSFDEDERKQNIKIERTPIAIQHRFKIAFKVALRLLGDYNMSIPALRVRLPRALQAELAGIIYAPAERFIVRAQ
jgi:hypothetical protein